MRDLTDRVTRLERERAEVQAELTSLTDKLTNQLKSMRQRAIRGVPDKSREELLNDAIRARRHRRLAPTNGEVE